MRRRCGGGVPIGLPHPHYHQTSRAPQLCFPQPVPRADPAPGDERAGENGEGGGIAVLGKLGGGTTTRGHGGEIKGGRRRPS